tara:strand:+ start:246 stop:599 length:354 start_codon:yes stop_codon:yes gene_type:complete
MAERVNTLPILTIQIKEIYIMEWLKSLWARWKVQVSVVGGVLVIATAYGTCSVDPEAVSTNTDTTAGTTASETIEVSATTETPNDANTANTTGDATTATGAPTEATATEATTAETTE